MRQARKGRQWYFGMKLHVSADSTGDHWRSNQL
jgi:hypothetical protein